MYNVLVSTNRTVQAVRKVLCNTYRSEGYENQLIYIIVYIVLVYTIVPYTVLQLIHLAVYIYAIRIYCWLT